MKTIVHRPKIGLIILFVMLGLFVSFALTNAEAATYYVADPKGIDGIAGTADDIDSSDNYAGTETWPFATLTKACAVAVAGNTVLIRGGVYAQILRPQNSGTAGSPITFRAYPGETVTIRDTPSLWDVTPDEVALDVPGTQYSIYMYGRSYITIVGLTVTHVGGWARIVYSDHIVIRGCNFSDATIGGYGAAIRFQHSDDNIVTGNTISGGSDNLSLIHSNRNLIEDNDITSARHTLWTIHAGNYNVIRNNYFYNALQKIGEILDAYDSWDPPRVYDAAKYNLVEHNIFAYTPPPAGTTPYSGIQYAGQNGIIRNNVFYDSNGIGLQMCVYANEARWNTFNRVYNNVFYNNIGGGIETGINSPPGYNFLDNVFKNNILYKNKAQPEAWNDYILGGTQTTHRRMGSEGFMFTTNNILGDVPGEEDVVYNLGIHNWLSLAAVETSYPTFYVNNIEVDPEFVDADNHDFHLNTGSRMIDAGAFLTKTVGTGSGTVLPVADVRYFFDGFDMTDENGLPIPGDLVQLEGDTKTARVIDIDYVNNTLTLNQPLSWTDGQGVSLVYNGSAPDIGAYEYKPTQAIVHPEVLVHINTAKFIALGGIDSQGRDSMASSLANDLTYEILTPPQHGTLSGNLVGVKTAVLTYVPTKDYQGPDSFTYRVIDGAWISPEYTIRLNVAPWKLPIGIPDPGFGIQESHWMYENATFDYTQAGTINDPRGMTARYEDAGNGPYTHYVDTGNPLATDGGNPYGTPVLPRRTIPYNLTAGSVVEVHSTIGDVAISGIGTAAKPIFVRGPSAVNRTPIAGYVNVGYAGNSTYIIVENIEALGSLGIVGRSNEATFETSYITLRTSESHSVGAHHGIAAYSYTNNKAHHVVLYNNITHDNGTWDPLIAGGDEDCMGFATGGGGTAYLWVLDNEMYHNSGDGIQNNTGDTGGHDFYVGRNVAHHNKQTGLWTKNATNVIFSQNTVYWHRVSSSSFGAGMGMQYGPENVWFIFNHIYDCNYGIALMGNLTDPGLNTYIIGNVIHNIHADEIYNNGTWASVAMRIKGGLNRHILGNTIYDMDYGICATGLGTVNIVNNIISNVTVAESYEVWIDNEILAAASVLWDNLFYRGGQPIRLVWGDKYSVYDLPGFQAAFPGVADGSIEADPLFVNPANNDFHLQAYSPAIDKGIETTVFKTFYDLYGIDIQKDYDANVRPQGSGWDIGAYEYTPPSGNILYGDVNGNGGVDANDASLTAMAAVELITLTDEQVRKADVNKSGQPDANDASLIAQYAVGLIDKFPVEG